MMSDDLNLNEFEFEVDDGTENINKTIDDIQESNDDSVEDVKENVLEVLDSNNNESNVIIDRESFNKFINCVKLVVDSDCTDCDIEQGIIRQISNNRRSIIKINLNSIIGDIDLSISNAVQKVPLLKTFELDDTVQDEGGVNIKVEDKRITFDDKYGHVSFSKPVKKMLDNNFLKDDEFSNKTKLVSEDKILDVLISSYIAKRRIKSICDVVKNDVITVKIKNNKASISIDTNDIKSTVIKNIELENGIELEDCTFETLLLPFGMDIQTDVNFSVYKSKGNNDKLLCKFELSYFNIPITIYVTTKMV